MEYRHLKFFIAVAEELHFTRAAARLRVAQPHLSHEIRRLEREVGVELFARNNRQVELTAAGRTFLERVRGILDATADAARAAQRADRGEIGRLVVGCGSVAAYTVVPNAIARLRRAYPEVEIVLTEFHSDEGVEALRAGRLDVCVVYPPRNVDPALHVEPITIDPLVVALPKGHVLAKSRQISLRRLSGEPWIFWHREIASRVYDEIVSACAAAGFEPRVVQRTTRLSTVICLVASGLGITLVPASATMLHVAGIVLREVHSPRIKIPLSLITRSGHRAPALTPFIAAVRDCARAVTKPARG
jgi:DNA-binding transcriptional LysR family regulator